MRNKKTSDENARKRREKRNAKRFAKHMENERIRHRMRSGDTWVAERMTKITDLEDLAEEMKHLKAEERLERMHRQWARIEKEHQKHVNANRKAQAQRLQPLKSIGVDVDKLVYSERISPMLHRNEALAHARQAVAQADRRKMNYDLAMAVERQRLADLSVTRRTAEDRAEAIWRLSNQIPLTATMDQLEPGMLPWFEGRPQTGDSAQRSHTGRVVSGSQSAMDSYTPEFGASQALSGKVVEGNQTL